jgi:hypothetical protein
MAEKKRRPSAYTQAFTEQQKETPAPAPEPEIKATQPTTPTPTEEPQNIVRAENHKSINMETQQNINTESQKSVTTENHKTTQAEESKEETVKTTLNIKKKLFQRAKIYAVTHAGETLGSIQNKALEMFLDHMENQ